MGTVVVDVMLKSEILDPQGQAIGGALPRVGFGQFTDVRQGKRFVLTVDGPVTQEHLDAARKAAETILSNPVLEDIVSVRPGEAAAAPGVDWDDDDEIDLALRGTGVRRGDHQPVAVRRHAAVEHTHSDVITGSAGVYDVDEDA